MNILKLLVVVAITLTGCATGEPPATAESPPAYGVVHAPLAMAEVGKSLVASGLLKPNEGLHLARLGTDIAYDVYLTPSAPGATDRLVFAIVTLPGAAAPKSAIARWTKDAWKTQKDLAGKVTVVQGRPAVVFDLATFPAGTEVRATFKLLTATGEVWLNNSTKDWLTKVLAPAPLQGVASLVARQDGWKRTLPADTVWSHHPLTITVETWPEVPGVSATLHWQVGAGPVTDTGMAIDAIHFGDYGMNTKWIASVPAPQLMPGSNLTFWVEAGNAQKTMWDSQNGKNYKGSIGKPPTVQWAQTGHTQFSKGWQTSPDGVWKAGYMFFAGLDTPFTSIPSSYWPPTKPALELYVPGLTDVAGNLDAATGGFVRVEVWSPFFMGKPTAVWRAFPLEFFEKMGNNWRFDWNLRLHGSPLSSPNGVAWADDGKYPYKFRISTDNGQSWAWLGTGALPDGGDSLTLDWQNLVIAPQLTVSGATAMAKTKTGKTATQQVSLVNTTNDTFTVKSCTVGGGAPVLAMTMKGCPAAGKTTTLAPGKRISVSLSFKPKAAGSYAATLTLDLASQQNPSLKGLFAVTFTGTAY